MNDPLFGSASLHGHGLLFADEDDSPVAGDALAAGDVLQGDVLQGEALQDEALQDEALQGHALPRDGSGHTATIAAQLLPWWSGAFAVALSDLPATGALSLRGPQGGLPLLAHARMLRGDGQTILTVFRGPLPSAHDAAHVLTVAGVGPTTDFLLRFAPAPFDRTLATLIGQAMAISGEAPDVRRNWQPLSRYLQGASVQAVRAELSLPIGDGLGLMLDGDVGPGSRVAPALVLDGTKMTATSAHLATDPQTGRTAVLVPVAGARFFVLLDDVLVEISCPAGATRSHLVRAPDAPFLRPSEAELLLDLVADAGLELAPRPADVLPFPNALGWRNADGGSLAVVGGLAVHAGTVLFIATDGREHELSRLLVRDVARPAEPLLAALQPIAAFHPEPDARPERLYLVALLPRRLGAGSLHLGLANAADAGGWIKLLDPAAAQTHAILQAWLPPAPDDEAYLHVVAASARTSASRIPAVVVDDRRPPSMATADTTIVVLGLAADAGAIERTVASIAATSQRNIPLLIVLRSSDAGFDATITRLAIVSEASSIDIGVIALAGPAGAMAALSVVFARLTADTVVLFDAGAQVVQAGWFAAAERMRPEAGEDRLILDGTGDVAVAAMLSRSAGGRLVAAADGRLATFSATLHDFARVAGDNGVAVVRADGFEVVPDAARAAAFEFRVDQVLLKEGRPAAVNRGHA
jgi:hypothetical protein